MFIPASVSTEISTTGRSHDWRRLLVSAGVRLLSAAAPGTAAALAEWLFLTPPRPRRRANLPAALDAADAFAVTAAGATVRGWRLGDGPTVLLVHGWGGRAAQLLPFAESLRAAGCSVVTFDGPAHGRSSGRLASAVHFAAAIEAIAARTAPRAVIAHSMGAAATSLAIAGGLPLDAAVFVGPARSPEPFFALLCDALGLPQGVRAATRRRLQGRFGAPLEHFDVVRLVGSARVPLLVVHDRDDREVAWRDGAAIAASWPGARLLTTSGLGHRRVLRDPFAQREATTFILERLPRCACGRLASITDGRCAACGFVDDLYRRAGRQAPIVGSERSGPRRT